MLKSLFFPLGTPCAQQTVIWVKLAFSILTVQLFRVRRNGEERGLGLQPVIDPQKLFTVVISQHMSSCLSVC